MTALKEWAVVIRAMAEMGQIMLFRKGGIVEKNNRFDVSTPEFFFYPTYLHQDADLLAPDYQGWIAQSEQDKPGLNQVKLQYYGRVEKVLEAKGIDRLRELANTTIWTPEYIEKTWSWAPEKPAYVMLIRVYELEKPYVIQEKSEYSGCISWINLEEALAVGNPMPVLSDKVFNQKCDVILEVLGHSVAALSP